MSLDLEDIKKMHDKAYLSSQQPREQAANDLVFYHISQWSDDFLQSSSLQYRGQFDVLRKAGRDIIANIRANPVQVNFDPMDEDRDDGADLLDGMYRTDCRTNTSIEAKNYAVQDAVVCGFGAWERYTEYETNRSGDENQIIKRRFIPEANNTAFCDPSAKRLDKSDSKFWSILTAYTDEGYMDLVEELTGKRPESGFVSFKDPEQSFTFPWFTTDKKIYITSFYHKEQVKDIIHTLKDPMGEIIRVRDSEFKDSMDELIDAGYELVSEKKIKRWEITKYIASGNEILKEERIAGDNIPVIPVYGERVFIEGVEKWEGITRLAKDPQMLRNFQLSYLADLVSRSPRNKPIVTAEMIQGYEPMYEENGADNNYPYYLMNSHDKNGNQLMPPPMLEMPEQKIPQALMLGIEISRQAIEDVANPGLPTNIADPDLSGKAIIALQAQFDKQSYIYQDNLKNSERYDGMVYASMAAEITDTPRTITVTGADGTRKKVKTMEMVFDEQTGEARIINDISNMEFDVYADIGPSYANKREETLETLSSMIEQLIPGDLKRDMLILKKLELIDGTGFDDIRKYAKRELMVLGVQEPDTPEDEQWLMEKMNQPQEPTAEMKLSEAENKKGDAAIMREQTNQFKAQSDAQDKEAGQQVDVFNAQTQRMNTQISAQEAMANTDLKRSELLQKRVDSAFKGRIEMAKLSNTDRLRGAVA